ncbi:MAG: hypothetical protein KatS3mg083_112 [Candidatus Dojkabacteria bacterium]|nr:MAG: hypothetical protein KatS3mg083_112 [Candidatus Dojkabacteria bacterium]
MPVNASVLKCNVYYSNYFLDCPNCTDGRLVATAQHILLGNELYVKTICNNCQAVYYAPIGSEYIAYFIDYDNNTNTGNVVQVYTQSEVEGGGS